MVTLKDNFSQLKTNTDSVSKALPEEAESRINFASQWQLIWWRFRKHKLALVSSVVVILIYFVAIFAGFLAPFTTERKIPKLAYAPPQGLDIWENTEDFQSKIEAFGTAAADFSSAAGSGDTAAIGGGLMKLGQACKGCHDDYRAE